MRGGTSKGVYILQSDLPEDKEQWEPLLLRLMGSPDKKQIDGLGGSQSVTSKVAIIKRSDRPDADVDYTFAQVSVDKPLVSHKGNCGNISSGVGPFSIEKGLVEANDGQTTVRIFKTNPNKIIAADVRTPGGHVAYAGDFTIAGVPGTASPVKLKFVEPAGTLGHGLLPTGNAVDTLDVPDFGPVQVSIVDAANPLVFVKAADLSPRGDELPSELDSDPARLDLLEKVRGLAAVKLGLIEDYTRSAWDTPGIPKMTFVSPVGDYVTPDGKAIGKDSIDLRSRMMSMQKTHPSYAMTGAMCTAASVVPGSIVLIMAAILILLGEAISNGKLRDIAVMYSHGGRVRCIEEGRVHIDIAFIGAPTSDECGNLRPNGGKSNCGVLSYAYVDAQYADKVVAVTDCLVPFPNIPASISMVNVDYVCVVDAIGDPAKIATGAAKPTTDQRKLLMAKYCTDFVVSTPYFKEGFIYQTGVGGASIASTIYLADVMRERKLYCGVFMWNRAK